MLQDAGAHDGPPAGRPPPAGRARPWPDPGPNSEAAGGNTSHSFLERNLHLLANATHMNLEVEGRRTELIWQLPPPGVRPRGVVMVAHGALRHPGYYWPNITCRRCRGNPAEMNITLHVLLRGYAVIAVGSSQREAYWSSKWAGLYPPEDNDTSRPEDWRHARDAIDYVVEREGLQRLPLYAFGASSGGAFSLSLPFMLPGRFTAILDQLGLAQRGVMREYMRRHKAGDPRFPHPYPPVLFMPMIRDNKVTKWMRGIADELEEAGVTVGWEPTYPRVLTPLYLAQRCAGRYDERRSALLYHLYRAAHYLDEFGYMSGKLREWEIPMYIVDVAQPGFRDAMRKDCRLSDIIAEVYAEHTLTSEKTTFMLDWIERLPSSHKGTD